MNTLHASLIQDPEFEALRASIIKKIRSYQEQIKGVRPPTAGSELKYAEEIQKFQTERGRDLFYPFLASGFGNGPWIELQDGSIKYDLISGIGVHFLGHGHSELMAAQIDALPGVVMHGNLQPGMLVKEITEKILKIATPGTRLKHAWITTCGTMANENALKMIRQKKYPATKIFAFSDCFAGRSTAMQEITDNAGYRDGQPLYGEVTHLPFYDPLISEEENIQKVCSQIDYFYSRAPGRYAAMMIELVQGEGGFRYGTKRFYKEIFEYGKKLNLSIWVDEVQTFGRTGAPFAYQTFELEKYIDIVTVAKSLQTSAVIYTEELNPKPGLVAGTFTGSTTALLSGSIILDKISDPSFYLENNKFMSNANYFKKELEKIKNQNDSNFISEIRAIGGMIAFKVFTGSLADTKKCLLEFFKNGVVAFYCGHNPYFIRMLPPFAVIEKSQIDEIIEILKQSLKNTQKEVRA